MSTSVYLEAAPRGLVFFAQASASPVYIPWILDGPGIGGTQFAITAPEANYHAGAAISSGGTVKLGVSRNEDTALHHGMDSLAGGFIPEAPWTSIHDPHDKALDSLSDRERLVAQALLEILEQEARRHYVYVEAVEIQNFRDFDDDSEEIILRQIVALPAVEALAYWDALGITIDQWMTTLPTTYYEIAVGRIGVDVQWDVDLKCTPQTGH